MIDDKRAILECKDIFVRVESIIKILNQDIIHKKISKDDDVTSVKSRINKITEFCSMYINKIERIKQTSMNDLDKQTITTFITQSAVFLKTFMYKSTFLLDALENSINSDKHFETYQESYIKYINSNDKLISLLNKHLH